MTLARVIGKRIALGLLAAWAVLTTVFGLFTFTDDWVLTGRLAGLKWAGASEDALREVRQEYLRARGLDRPLHEQYLDWMGNMVTLDWGESFVSGEPVFDLVMQAAGRTAMYVAPAVVLGVAIGVSIGLYAGLNPDSKLADASTVSAYLLFAIPGFWIGGLALSLVMSDWIGYSSLWYEHLLPIGLTTATLLGGYVTYTRAHTMEYAPAEFVTLVRAKGASRRRIALHVLRNAAIPVFSMLFTEALALLVLAVFVVESLFGIDGFGLLLVDAIDQRNLPVVMGGTLVIIAVGVAGNVIQDLSYRALDPRVDTESR